MNAIYTTLGMITFWAMIAIVAAVVAFYSYHTVYTMIKAVDFLRFHSSMSLRNDPSWKFTHNLAYTYIFAVGLLWSENGDSTTITHGCGTTYKAFNWK